MTLLDHAAAAAHGTDRSKAMAEGSLRDFFARMKPGIRSQWAWDNYKPCIERLAGEFGLMRMMEIGGGRDPAFTPAEVSRLGADYTVNDISQEELRHAPPAFNKACFDVAGDLRAAGVKAGGYDLVFSRMVFEHVHDVARAWRNLHTILAPGGVALAFIPTLYSPPYVVNMMIPERLSQWIVKLLYPHRTDEDDPKFPAYYDWAFGSERKVAPMLRAAGFSEAMVVPFYGHDYFRPLPGIREIDEALTRLSIRFDWRMFTSYAYILARK